MTRTFRVLRVFFFGILAVFIVSPLAYLAISAMQGGWSRHLGHVGGDLSSLLAQTFFLAAGATVVSIALSVPFAWLVARSDMPGRGFFRALGALPLAIPPYIGALTFVILLGPMGTVNRFLISELDLESPVLNIYSLWGGIFILGLFTFPYVYLFCVSLLERTNPALEESARLLGAGPFKVFFRVTLPLLKPALLGGGLLVFLYSFADFGAVSMLRLNTFTTRIYEQLNTYFDYTSASVLSIVLVVIAGVVLIFQQRVLGRARFVQVSSGVRPAAVFGLGKWRWIALLYPVLLFGICLGAPLVVLIGQVGSWAQFWNTLVSERSMIGNSLWTALLAATACVAISLSVVYLSRRGKKPEAKILSGLVTLQYAIPGTVLGLALILLYNRFLPWVYASALMIVIGYVLKFLPQSQQGIQAAWSQVHPHFEESARSLGARTWACTQRVILPLVRPGLIASWTLVFVSSMKELGATLLLRPAGFDTLPIRVWIHTVEADYAGAASMAIFLIIASAFPLIILQRSFLVNVRRSL